MGRPKGPEIESKITLRIKKDPNFPYLKEKIQEAAEKAGYSFGDYCVGILKSVIKRNYLFTSSDYVDDEGYLFYKKVHQIIESKINELENAFHLEERIKRNSLEDYISVTFTNANKKKIFLLDLLQTHLASEFVLLEKLLRLTSSLNLDNKISLEAYFKKDSKKKSEIFTNEVHDNLFNAYMTEIWRIGIFKENFEIDFKILESFVIKVLCRDIEFKLNYHETNEKLDKRKEMREKNYRDYFLKSVRGLIDKSEINTIRIRKHTIEESEEKYYKNKIARNNSRFFEARKQLLISKRINGITQKDFMEVLNEYFNKIYLSSLPQYEIPYEFKLYFIPIAVELDKYYQFMSNNNTIFDFYVTLKEGNKISESLKNYIYFNSQQS